MSNVLIEEDQKLP